MKTCIICNNLHHAKGLCRFHYDEKRLKDNPERAREIWQKSRLKNYSTQKNTERFRLYRKTKTGIKATRRAINKYELTHPERRNAWNKAQQILKKPCIQCGKFPTHRHHPDPLKPLNVIFLCPLHHKKIHKSRML